MVPPKRIETLWPVGLADLSTHDLQQLDDATFAELRRRFQDRQLRRGAAPKRAKEISRELRKRRHPKRIVPIPKHMLLAQRRDSELLESLVPDRGQQWQAPTRRQRQGWEIALKSFSFLDHPGETLKAIEEIALAECTVLNGELHFDDEWILDIGPYLVLALMRQDMMPFLRGGRMRRAVQKVIEAVDLRLFLRMGRFHNLHDLKDVWAFPLRRRRAAGTSTADDLAQSSTSEEKVIGDLVETVDYWLFQLEPSFELTRTGKAWLAKAAGEILDNAKRHSRLEGDGDWSAVGFMAKRIYGEAL